METEGRDAAHTEGQICNITPSVESRRQFDVAAGHVRGSGDTSSQRRGKKAWEVTHPPEGVETVTISRQYIAGFFDGEGCIGLSQSFPAHNIPYLRASISNTKPEILWAIAEAYGGNVTLKQKTSSSLPNAKPAYVWQLTNARAERFILSIIPYLVMKRPQAELALAYQQWAKSQTYDDRMFRVRVEGKCEKKARLKGGKCILQFSRPSYLLKARSFKERMNEMNRKGIAKVG